MDGLNRDGHVVVTVAFGDHAELATVGIMKRTQVSASCAPIGLGGDPIPFRVIEFRHAGYLANTCGRRQG